MSEHLMRAARARHDDTMKRAMGALSEMVKSDQPISFAAVARRANVSTDFLYGTPELRSRITALRHQPSPHNSSPTQDDSATSTTAIRALSTQLRQQRRRHREELQTLREALAAAHGENLELRRRLTRQVE